MVIKIELIGVTNENWLHTILFLLRNFISYEIVRASLLFFYYIAFIYWFVKQIQIVMTVFLILIELTFKYKFIS